MGVREDLAAALSTVSGVNGYPIRPKATDIGDAWLRWMGDTHEPEAPGVFVTEWQIIVLVPLDEAKQEEWVAARRWPLVDAITPLAYVVNLLPGTSDDRPALVITVRE